MVATREPRCQAARLIALNGLMGSGKSTVSAHLIAQYGFTLIKFAGPLKTMLHTFLAAAGADALLVERMIEGDLKEEPSGFLQGQTPRHAMQTLGTEWGRTCLGSQLWVQTLVSRVMRELAAGHSVVVDDCRFVNEAEAIRQFGGVIWRVTRPDVLLTAHPSEFDQLHVTPDLVLQNSGSLDDLVRAVDARIAWTLTTAPLGVPEAEPIPS